MQSVKHQSLRICFTAKYLLGKLLVSILLVSISLPVAISGLNQPAQTVTSTVTISSVFTTIQTSSNAYSGGYLVPAVSKGSTDCGTYKHYVFNASAVPITGTVTSNSTELNFEVASLSDFNVWAPNGVGINCRGPENAIVTYEAVTSNTFSANLPSNGYYVMTFINTPADKAAYVNISMNYPYAYTIKTTSYTLQTQLQTETSVGNPLTSIPGFPVESILVGFLLALAILVAKRSRKTRLAQTKL